MVRRICFAIVFLSSVMALAQDAVRFDKIAQSYRDKDGFNGQITIARDGKILLNKGYGYANLEWQILFTPDTRFNVGSISKQFTAAAILLLQEDGKLHTSDTLGSHLPTLPAAWQPITLRQLLSHTSGIPSFNLNSTPALRFTTHSPAELLEPVKTMPLDFAPGSKYDYNNSNYLLLALVVEQASGQPFCTFLKARVIDLAGLHDTVCLTEPASLPHRAAAYVRKGSDFAPAAMEVPSFWIGSGGLISTGPDLVRWTESLHSGHLLSAASFKEMTTPVLEDYGYGLMIDRRLGHPEISHTGAITGFYSAVSYFPDTRTTVVTLSNVLSIDDGMRSPGTGPTDSELDALAADPRAILPSEGTEVSVPATTLDRYAGAYKLAGSTGPAVFEVTRKGLHLSVLQTTPGTHYPSELRPETATYFYLADEEVEIEFDPQGHATVYDLRNEAATKMERLTPNPNE